MELIDRYVQAVGERLHPSRRRDVEAELRASILDALEARGASPESEDDVAAVLSELGEPERMAAEYQPNRRYLIGPELFPLFRRVLRVMLVTLVMASTLGFGVSLLLGGLADFRAGVLLMDTLWFALLAAIVAMVVLVAVFAWLQRAEVRVPRVMRPGGKEWDPRSLATRHPTERAPRFESVAGLVAAAVVLVILGGIGQVAREVIPHALANLRPLIQDGVVANVMLLQVGLVVSALAHAIALLQGSWHTYTRGMRLVADAIGVFVFVRLPFQLLDHRSGLLDAGLSRNFVNWLVANAFVVAAVLLVIVVAYWWRAWRRASRVSGRSLREGSLAATALLVGSLAACASAPRETAEIVSPEVDQDGRITFRYHAPDAGQVMLIRGWEQPLPMVANARGIWSHTTEPLPPDLYAYHFTIDGKPNYDPRNPLGKPVVTGGRESLAHVPGPDSLPWEFSDAPAGELQRHEYRSARFGEPREVWVYTPPGYEAGGARRYPVLYLLHGVFDDARAWSTAGRVNVILDNLLAAGSVEPMIVAMPHGYGLPDAASRVGEMFSPATDQRAVMDEFAAGLLGEVLPLVEREYRTRPEPASRAIAGLSMGGSQALYIGLNNPETFGSVASFGGALIMYGGRYEQWFGALAPRDTTGPGIVTLSVGREDFLLGANRHFVAWLESRGTRLELEEVSGGHTWSVWRRELIRLAPRLFRDGGGV